MTFRDASVAAIAAASALASLLLFSGAGVAHATDARAQLCSDCNRDSSVTVEEVVAAVGVSLSACPATPICCGDCDQDGRVEIHDLIAAVNSLLGSELAACGLDCFGPCYFPIAGDPPCPCPGGGCSEALALMEPDRTIRCAASICSASEDQVRSCILLLRRTTDLCYDERH